MNIIFDYDGTLHETLNIYKPAFLRAYEWLVANEYAPPREFTDEEIRGWIGYNARAMWETFMPELPEDVRAHCSEIVGQTMREEIEAGTAKLYRHALEILDTLREQGHTLIFFSNCKRYYMEAHTKAFGLNRYFYDMYCTEDYDFKPKHEIFPEIAKKYGGNFIVVGDRANDIEIAKRHGLYSIGCAYGYGSREELRDADAVINFPLEMLSYIPAGEL
ncbi:MAG: HAD family hydrolase [Clostridia bacterium]|nr:HAD family hydrolase [Clostridia bacterium]